MDRSSQIVVDESRLKSFLTKWLCLFRPNKVSDPVSFLPTKLKYCSFDACVLISLFLSCFFDDYIVKVTDFFYTLFTQLYRISFPQQELVSKSGSNSQKQQDETDIFGGSDEFEPGLFSSDDLMEELEMMHPAQREAFMDELAVRSDFWDEEMEVFYE